MKGEYCIEIVIRKHAHARSIKMRIDPIKRIVVVTVPKRCQQTTIDDFIEKSHIWLTQQQHKFISQPLPSTLDLNDQKFFINYLSYGEAEVFAEPENHIINIYGHADDHRKQLIKHLKSSALKHAILYVKDYAQQLGVNINTVGVKEYKARWGCCYQRGDIYLFWRLIMAPAYVLRYVCAHEVAHLIHQNHSPQFWQVVSAACPDYQSARRWLRDHGPELFNIL